jgi:hypothetical protein
VLLSARSFGDRVNPDAAKDPAAANAEENILGLLLLYPEHRKAVSGGLVELGADDFFTDLGRRAFEAVMTMEQSESGFLFSALGEHFNPDEMGRLVRMTREREELQTNDRAVLEAAASALRRMREKRESRAVGDVQGELARRRAEAQQRRK